MTTVNPFIRGISTFNITRKLAIDYGNEFPLAYRPLHPSQSDLSSHEVDYSECVFNNDVAYISTKSVDLDVVSRECPNAGIVRSVIFELVSFAHGRHLHIGDFHSLDDANNLIQQVAIQNGHYSRCWEISSAHVTEEAFNFLLENTSANLPYVEAFVVGDRCVGVKLICTPWTNNSFSNLTGQSTSSLKKEMLDTGMPESLVNLLFLAAEADTRILILDADAPTLNNLPVYDW